MLSCAASLGVATCIPIKDFSRDGLMACMGKAHFKPGFTWTPSVSGRLSRDTFYFLLLDARTPQRALGSGSHMSSLPREVLG